MANNICKFLHVLKCDHKTFARNVYGKIFLSKNFERRYSSALYISGKKAHKTFSFLSPYIDVDERFEDIDKLQNEILWRGMNIDVVELKKVWNFYKAIHADKHLLEDNSAKIGARITTLMECAECTPKEEQEKIKLRTQLTVIREDIKRMKEAIWELDEDVVERVLKLPCALDSRTPIKESMVLKNIGDPPNFSKENKKSHINIGINLGILEYKNPIHFYLCNDAALFEYAVLAYTGRVLSNNNMIKVAGADFSRSLVVEGSGLNHEDPMTTFVINNHGEVERESPNRMHLVGGASLISFLALHTKQLINPNKFPLKYFSTGRQYTPSLHNSQSCDLFTVCQASVAQTFIIVKDKNSEEYKTLFQELVEVISGLYNDLCSHYRVVMRSASELQPWEGLRVSFEMWSPFTNQYIEIGHISACNDYFSKRLLIAYQTPTGRDFPVVISGTVLSVPRLLGCLLEQNPEKLVIPPKAAEFVP